MDDPNFATTALNRQKHDKRRKSEAKECRDNIIYGAVSRLSEAKEKNGGRMPYGKMQNVIQGRRIHPMMNLPSGRRMIMREKTGKRIWVSFLHCIHLMMTLTSPGKTMRVMKGNRISACCRRSYERYKIFIISQLCVIIT